MAFRAAGTDFVKIQWGLKLYILLITSSWTRSINNETNLQDVPYQALQAFALVVHTFLLLGVLCASLFSTNFIRV